MKKWSSCVPWHAPALFLFIHETMSCLQEAETGFMHVTCTALLHKGIWHPKLSCLLKPHHQQVHQRSQDWLSLGVYWTALCTGKDWGLSGAQLTPSKSGAVRYRHASGLILTKEKEKKKAERAHSDFILFLNAAHLEFAYPCLCELSGLRTALESSHVETH